MTTATSSAAVLETIAAASGPVLVEFGAEWCPPCRVIEPVLAELARANDDLTLVAVDSDEQRELAMHFDVMSVPTLLFFADGELCGRVVGARGLSILQAELDRVRSLIGA